MAIHFGRLLPTMNKFCLLLDADGLNTATLIFPFLSVGKTV